MASKRARFRELSKVGKKLEAAFHVAGFVTWADLVDADADEVAAAANEVRPTSNDQVAAWQAAAARHVGSAEHRDEGRGVDDDVAGPDTDVGLVESEAERSHSFVVTVVIDEADQVLRTSVRSVRTDLESRWPGWPVDRIARFVEAETHLHSTARTATPPIATPWRSTVHLGATVGGERPVSVTIPAAELPRSKAGSYAAQLLARSLGQGAGSDLPLAAVRGGVEPNHDLTLDFGRVHVPMGAHHLQVKLEVNVVSDAAPGLAFDHQPDRG